MRGVNAIGLFRFEEVLRWEVVLGLVCFRGLTARHVS